MSTPLAERLRPQSLDEFIGQEHLVGKGAVLRRMIESGRIPSIIFWGPPGVGKTTLANIIANAIKAPFYKLSAINSGVKDVREVIEKAKSTRFFDSAAPILFIDEIHRFSKSQQDSLLNAVETGTVTLIGATTENPSFEVIRPLLSRCQVYVLKSMEKKDLQVLLNRALTEDLILKERKIKVEETDALFRFSGGDARKLMNILELTVATDKEDKEIVITDYLVTERLQENPAAYDKGGEMHYDIISAFIKSIRGSDPDAAIYWLARMVAGGEDPKFIARRLVISAAEDIGLAIDNAISKVEQTGNLPVPLHLRNAPTSLMKELDYGKDYKYSHDYENNFVKQDYLPKELKNSRFWEPQSSPAEKKLSDWMKKLWGD
jgi:putative ATPase